MLVETLRSLRLPSARTFSIAALALLILCRAVHSYAADLSTPSPQIAEPIPAPDQGLVFAVTVYGWASGLSGRARTLPPLPAVKIDIGFDKVIQNLNGAFMAATELRSGRFILFTDFIFAKIAPSKEFAIPRTLGLGVKLDSTSLIGLAAAGYRIVDDPQFFVDGFAGVRGFSLDNVLKLDTGAGPSVSFGKTETWADPAIGARMRFNFNESWFASVIGFAGGTRPNPISSGMCLPGSATVSPSATPPLSVSACSRSTMREATISTMSSNTGL
jgi:hypothetical protein